MEFRTSGGKQGRRSGSLLETLTRVKLGSKANNISAPSDEDPYEFQDTQSLQQPPSPETPRAPPRPLTPLGSKKKRTPTSTTRKSPAELREERLRRMEEEEMAWALEESRKEAAREERKRRREKRDEEEVQRDEETTSTKTPKEADAAARAQSEEPITCVGGTSTDFSQSTPPLSGVPHSSLSTPTRRTPVLRVTRLPHTPVRGVGSHDRDVTPVLGEGWDKGEGGDGEVKDSAAENKLDETVGPREKRHSLALSLKRGKRRVCEEISTSSTTITNITLTTSTSSEEPPSSKRQRVGLEGSTGRATVSTPQTPPETQEVSLPQNTTLEPTAAKSTTQEPTAAKSTTQEPTAAKSTTLEPTAARSTTLEPTAAKTTTLEPTAAKGITLEPTAAKGTTWEQKLRRRPSKSMLPDLFAPVGVAPAAYSATILRVFNSYISQLREAQNRVLSRVAWGNPVPAHHRQPLSTLTWHSSQSRPSLVRPGGSPSWPSIDLQTGEIVRGCLSGRRVGSKRKRPRASFAEEDDDSFVSTPDKRRSGTPVKQRQVQKHRDTGEDGSGERWSDLPPVTTGTTHTLSVPAHSTTPDSPPDKLRPLPVNSDLSEETAPRASQSMLAPPPVGVASSLLLSGQGRQCELGEGEIGEGGIGEGEIGEGGIGEGEIGEGGVGDGENSETGEQGTRGERGGAAGVASSEEAGDDIIRPRKRRRAVILEDSDSETELDSISSSSNDVTVTKNSTEPTGKSNSLFKRALAVLGGGRKRQSVKQLPVKGGKPLSGSRGSVVDLTAGRGGGQKMSHPREKGELVPCPLCSELFPLSLVEAHAAICQEEGPGESSSRPPPPLRQSSLLTPRFNRARVVSPSSPSGCVEEGSGEGDLTDSTTAGGEEDGEGEDSASNGPRVVECEGGGYQVDPSTISTSPIRTFRRITELDPQERAGFYNQFSSRGTRGRRGQARSWGRSTGSSEVNSRRGRGRGNKGRGRYRFFRRRGKKT